MSQEEKYLNEEAIFLALSTLSGKWRLKIMWEISLHETIRFNQLRNNIEGISNLMLSKCLKELIDLNLVARKQYNEIPPRVEYSLTEFGNSTCPLLYALEEYGKKLKNEVPF